MQNYSGDINLQYHTQLRPGDVGEYVILPGGSEALQEDCRTF